MSAQVSQEGFLTHTAMGTTTGNFYELLQRYQAQTGVRLPLFSAVNTPSHNPPAALEVHGTTVIALKFKGGVLNVGDRRATAANVVMYDRADKIIPLDDQTMIAIAGAYGRAMEVVRYLRHAFRYYARSQLQPMSLDGKLQEVSRALAANLPNALGGIGLFVPILSVYDPDQDRGRIFFFDITGARFETQEYGAAGSGSERIRGVFDYITKTKGAFSERSLEEVLREAILLLDIAADLDAATGGIDKVLPTARYVTRDGVFEIPESTIREIVQSIRTGGPL
ncbi:MAG: proteasome subunit alpha [Armatimonadota bacterium]|nr:proteasome subunit alpha [Armatimonadota bacterium]